MNNILRFKQGLVFGVVAVFLMGSSVAFAKKLPNVKKAPASCVAVTTKCSVCADGKYRENLKTGLGKELKGDAWSCANNGKLVKPIKSITEIEKKLEHSGCKILSSFCAICPGEEKSKTPFRFVFLNDGKDFNSDLLECRTHPQTLVSKAGH